MRRDIISRILLILTATPLVLTAPVLVQEKREACADEVHVPRDVPVITVLGKRADGDDLHMLWDLPWHFGNIWGEPADYERLADYEPPPRLAAVHVPGVHAPQPDPAVQAPEVQAPQPNPALAEVQAPEVHPPAPDLEGAHLPQILAPPNGPAEFDRESMVFDDDAPPGSPGPGHSPPESSPPSPLAEWTPESEYWHTPPSSPRPEPPTLDTARMELQSAVDPRPFPTD